MNNRVDVFVERENPAKRDSPVSFTSKQGFLLDIWCRAENLEKLKFILGGILASDLELHLIDSRRVPFLQVSVAQLEVLPAQAESSGTSSHAGHNDQALQ
jgi:hypothetical protein